MRRSFCCAFAQRELRLRFHAMICRTIDCLFIVGCIVTLKKRLKRLQPNPSPFSHMDSVLLVRVGKLYYTIPAGLYGKQFLLLHGTVELIY